MKTSVVLNAEPFLEYRRMTGAGFMVGRWVDS